MLHDLPVRLRIAVSEVQSARRRLRANPGTMSASLSPSLHPQVDWGRVFGRLSAMQEEVGRQELIHIPHLLYWPSIKKIKEGWASCWILLRRSSRSSSFGSRAGVFFTIQPIYRFPPFCLLRRSDSVIDRPNVPSFAWGCPSLPYVSFRRTLWAILFWSTANPLAIDSVALFSRVLTAASPWEPSLRWLDHLPLTFWTDSRPRHWCCLCSSEWSLFRWEEVSSKEEWSSEDKKGIEA